jgi:hypothetical protein
VENLELYLDSEICTILVKGGKFGALINTK